MKRKFIVLLVLISLFMAACSKKAEPAKESAKELSIKKMTVTYVTSPLNVPSILEKEEKVFETALPGVEINYAEITSGADQTQALASGDVQLLNAVGGSSVILAAANGIDIKIISMYSRAPKAFALYASDKNLTTPESLKGKKIAGPAGTNLHELLVAYLEKGNMTIQDVEFVSMRIPEAIAALEGGSIDVAMLGGPAAYKADQAGYHKVTDGEGLIDAIIAVATTQKFMDEHPDVIEKVKEGQEAISQMMKNEPEKTKKIVSEILKIDEEAFDAMYPMYNFSTAIDEKDVQGLQRTANFMKETDMIEKDVNVEELFVK